MNSLNPLLPSSSNESRESESTDVFSSLNRVLGLEAGGDVLHDALTGLPSLPLFNDRLTQALMQAKRHSLRLAVMFIDLDGCKAIAETHGKHTGDQLMKLIGQRIISATRGEDTLSRRGDGFLFLMPEAAEASNVAALASKLVDVVGKVCRVDGHQLAVKPSIGVAIFPDDGSSGHELLEKARAAMELALREASGSMFWDKLDGS